MWAPSAVTNIFGTDCPCQTLSVRAERYGGFIQASYKLDGLKQGERVAAASRRWRPI